MPNIQDLLSKLRQQLPFLRDQYQVQDLGVFGSYARNEQTPGSDLDLLVTFQETPGFFKYLRLENYLTDQLGVKVDLVMRDALKPQIGGRILREVKYLASST